MPIDCLNTISCIKKIGRVQSAVLIRCFALVLTLGSAIPSAVAQPPVPGTENMAYHLPEVDAEWNRLRDEVGTLEFTQPKETIERYQKFYEQRGLRSLTTAVKISTVIAQIYWQQLGNHTKALEIYDWMIGKFGDMPHMARLQKERDDIANAPGYGSLVDAKPVAVGVPANNSQLAPVKLNGPVSSPTAVGVPNLTIAIPPMGSSRIASGAVTVNNSMGALPGGLTVKTGQAGGIAFPATVGLPVSSNSQIPSVNQGVVAPENKSFFLGSVAPVNPRLASLSGYLAQWKSGQMTWEQMVQTANFTAEDVKLLAASPNSVSMYSSGRELRVQLGQLIQKFPDLTQSWATLPVPAQIVLAEAYSQQQNPEAKKIYQQLLDQEVPLGAWWNKEHITYRLAEYHKAIGEYEEAAALNLKIAEFTKSQEWKDDSYVAAARHYMRGGLTSKAEELYRKVEETAIYSWAKAMVITDRSRLLMAAGEHEKARKVLSTPVTGPLENYIAYIHQMLMGDSYLATGDLQKAHEYLSKAVGGYYSIPDRWAGENMPVIFASAKERLGLVEQWIKEPIQVMPPKVQITLNAKQPHGRNIIQRLRLRTYRDVPLRVVTDNPNVKASVSFVNSWNENNNVPGGGTASEKEVILEIQASVLQKNKIINANLIVDSSQLEFQVKVPISIGIEGEENLS